MADQATDALGPGGRMRALVERVFVRLRISGVDRVLAGGAARVFVGNVAIALAALGAQVVLTRAMGRDQFGVYAYAFTWLMVLTLPAKLGLDTGAVRFVAQYVTAGDWPRLKGFLRSGGLLALGGTAFVAAVAVWAIATGRAPGVGPAMRPVAFVTVLVLPLYVLQVSRAGAAQGFRDVALGQRAELLRLIVSATLVGAAWALSGHVTAVLAMALQGLAIGGAVAVSLAGIWRKVAGHWNGVEPVTDTRTWLRVSFPLFLISATHLAMRRTDVLMLGAMVDPGAAGVYQVAGRLADLMVFGLTAINAFAAPMMAESHAAGRTDDLRRIARLTARVGAVTTFLALGVLTIGGEMILRLFGPGFEAGHGALMILAGGQLMNALAGSVGILMSMTGHQDTASAVLVGAAGLNVVLNLVLIPRYGMLGAALATATSTVAWNVALAIQVRRRLGISSTAF